MRTFQGRDIISINDFTKEEILHVLMTAQNLKKKPQPKLLESLVLATCFFEPSTRTRLSFESAMLRLGGSVTGFADPTVTSTKKGETLSDTMKIVSQYVDVLVIRHPLDGAARLAAGVSEKPVINAGDGSNQHPTQTFLDLFTIQETQKKLGNLSVAFVGDLKHGRTVHSLSEALVHFDARVYCVAPDVLQMPQHILDVFKAKKIKYSLHKTIDEVISKVDILYMTRIQSERFSDQNDYEKVKNVYTLTAPMLANASAQMRVLHPLPRITEITTDVDVLPQAYYFQQAQNGLYVRQAVLGLVLGKL